MVGEEPQFWAALAQLDGYPHLPLIQARLVMEGYVPLDGVDLLRSVGLVPDNRALLRKGKIAKPGVSVPVILGFLLNSVFLSWCRVVMGELLGGPAKCSPVLGTGGGLWPGV
jgi:hypothetical protein